MSDMHRRKAYMYINFQQNRVSRSVKTVDINLFAKNHKHWRIEGGGGGQGGLAPPP